MKAKTTILLWVLCLALMPLCAAITEWLAIIPAIGFIRLSLYLEKNNKRFIRELKLID